MIEITDKAYEALQSLLPQIGYCGPSDSPKLLAVLNDEVRRIERERRPKGYLEDQRLYYHGCTYGRVMKGNSDISGDLPSLIMKFSNNIAAIFDKEMDDSEKRSEPYQAVERMKRLKSKIC